MRKTYFLFFLAMIAFSGCSTMSREPNSFFIDGRRIDITDSWLARIRTVWATSTELTLSSKLKPDDRQWALDYVALREELKHKCTQLKLLEINKNQTDLDLTLYGKTFHPIEFNELWVLNSCGTVTSYHVFEDQRILNVVPAKL